MGVSFLEALLEYICLSWVKERKVEQFGNRNTIVQELGDIEKSLDSGIADDHLLFKRVELSRQLHEIDTMASRDAKQKSKIKWAIEGDENSKFFHGIINKKRSQLAIRGVFDNGKWCSDPVEVANVISDIISDTQSAFLAKRNILHDTMASRDAKQKSKIKWAIEGDENSKFFHGIINKKRSQLAIRGVFDNGKWCSDPVKVKEIFKNHFQTRFEQPTRSRFKINFQFNKCL
nr:RNA-directed DNA polymerase, eukaryota, reverse transcriptase zinc-binding domain protein [Tanacetum cinerariifolium]